MPILLANRYARALADVVAASGDYRKVLEELQDFQGVYGENQELREAIASPVVPLPNKMKVVEMVVKALGGSPVTWNFLRVLLSNYRFNLLPEVLQAYRKIAKERLGIVEVTVSSASELSEAERESLAGWFRGLTGKRVELEFRVESGLLGGILAQVGSTVYDGSVRGQLARMKEQLTAR
jgi:F-type H+-transporting ATPase subunit delta